VKTITNSKIDIIPSTIPKTTETLFFVIFVPKGILISPLSQKNFMKIV
jgi:hypothetical protein